MTSQTELINSADLFVHVPSLPESFGQVVLAAMQMGKPVITSNVGGPSEIVVNGVSGLLVPPGSPWKLADAIIRLLSNSKLCAHMGHKTIKIIEDRFAPETFNNKINTVYSNLTSGKKAGLI